MAQQRGGGRWTVDGGRWTVDGGQSSRDEVDEFRAELRWTNDGRGSAEPLLSSFSGAASMSALRVGDGRLSGWRFYSG